MEPEDRSKLLFLLQNESWIIFPHRTTLPTQYTPAETNLAFGPAMVYKKVMLHSQMEPECHFPPANMPCRTVKCFSHVARKHAKVASKTGKLGEIWQLK